MSNTDTELQRMYDMFIEELEDVTKLSLLQFVLEHQYPALQKELDSLYMDYVNLYDDNPEDMLFQDEWEEEVYSVENEDDLIDLKNDCFCDYGRNEYVHTKYPEYKWVEINIAGGGPVIDLIVDTAKDAVKWIGRWGGDKLEQDLSYKYSQICELYNINEY